MNVVKRLSGVANNVLEKIVEQAFEFADVPKVSDEEFERRIAICESCENFNAENRKCKLCGCFMDVKAELKELPAIPGMSREVKCSDKVNTRW